MAGMAGCTQAHPAMTREKQVLMQEEIVYFKDFLALAEPLVEIASDEEQTATERYTKIFEIVMDEKFSHSYQAVLDNQKRIINLDGVDRENRVVFAVSSDAEIRLLAKYIELEANVTERQKETGQDFEACARSCLAEGLSTKAIENIKEIMDIYEKVLAEYKGD